ncbi:hypothetical protein BOO69_08260 [Sulfitobacter alexandrii]|uniref:Phage gp6-like head-tail connector protein n=2 Tax=Sulfitobacter alexandrii TaxID=1917485 RepID=A0A1J0WLZ1_9RHOB|nr:hypothetical protein BOO69_08260 [Sulfitobacter alexandrii]
MVVSTAEMKAHLRVDFADDDAQIEGFIKAATARLDGYAGILGRCLVTQTWSMRISDWPKSCLLLPFPDVSAALIEYQDSDGDDRPVDAGMYELVEGPRGSSVLLRPSFTRPAVFQDVEMPITLTMTAGYGNPAAVPHPIKTAIMMLAAHFYAHRGAAEKAETMPFGVSALVAPYRRGLL